VDQIVKPPTWDFSKSVVGKLTAGSITETGAPSSGDGNQFQLIVGVVAEGSARVSPTTRAQAAKGE
jgi:hypothetical protein